MNKITSSQPRLVTAGIEHKGNTDLKTLFDWLLHFVSSLFYADVHEKSQLGIK